MGTIKRLYRLLLGAIVAIIAIIWLGWANIAISKKTEYLYFMDTNRQKQELLPKDPCWFMTLKQGTFTMEMLEERNKRKMHGYPAETPLSEAIRMLNEENQCVSTLAPYPPLTEDELIAAIVAGPDYVIPGEAWQSQREALWRIATQKMMPKGSLLVATSGSRVQESPLKPDGTIRSQGISIVLLLGLENHTYGHMLKPEQSYIIRRTYFKVETIK